MNALRYVAVGDSYTIGTSVSESERWPNQLVAEVSAARVVAVSTPDYTLTPQGRAFGDLDQLTRCRDAPCRYWYWSVPGGCEQSRVVGRYQRATPLMSTPRPVLGYLSSNVVGPEEGCCEPDAGKAETQALIAVF